MRSLYVLGSTFVVLAIILCFQTEPVMASLVDASSSTAGAMKASVDMFHAMGLSCRCDVRLDCTSYCPHYYFCIILHPSSLVLGSNLDESKSPYRTSLPLSCIDCLTVLRLSMQKGVYVQGCSAAWP